ncbi:MAG: hypothetical protein JXP73_10705 [Deltaproteobacteria bacterium]|nr:hypothetical protein [Deltaproteobacteria bacterium]
MDTGLGRPADVGLAIDAPRPDGGPPSALDAGRDGPALDVPSVDAAAADRMPWPGSDAGAESADTGTQPDLPVKSDLPLASDVPATADVVPDSPPADRAPDNPVPGPDLGPDVADTAEVSDTAEVFDTTEVSDTALPDGPTLVNECQLGTHDCDVNATCTDLPVGFFCTCLGGFVGDGRTCRSCQLGNGGCDPLTTCSTVGNTIVCGACPSGYSDVNQDGTLCTEINECSNGTHDCDAHAICSNSPPGSFSCACQTGWLGDGRTCKAGVKWISVYDTTNCAVKYDGTLWCWGALGFGPYATVNPVPGSVTSMTGWDTFNWDQTRCGIRSGALYCWGTNNWGSAGVGSTDPVESPTRVGTASDWTWFAGTSSSSCGIRGGNLYCWGYVNGRKTGDTVEQNYTTPQPWSTAGGWQAVEFGWGNTCGIRSGELYCWGAQYGCTLGDGVTEESALPLRIGTATDWTAVAAGCGVRSGSLYCWGDNDFGRIGNGASGTGAEQKTPLHIGLAADWTTVDSGKTNYTTGLRAGIAYSWGNNNGGELGIGTLDDPLLPTLVDSNLSWQQVRTSTMASCGISGHKVYCWGQNNYGQLGDGTIEERLSPVEVIFPE